MKEELLFTAIHDAYEVEEDLEVVGVYIYGGLMYPPKPLELIYKWEKEGYEREICNTLQKD